MQMDTKGELLVLIGRKGIYDSKIVFDKLLVLQIFGV